MSLVRLNSLRSRIVYNDLLRGVINSHNRRTYETDKVPAPKSGGSEEEEENNEPIQYSTSPAATWAAEHSQRGGKDEIPWFQPLIVSGSVMIFMVYFFILREPNDVDAIFDMELGDHFKHIDMDALKKSAGVPNSDDRSKKNT